MNKHLSDLRHVKMIYVLGHEFPQIPTGRIFHFVTGCVFFWTFTRDNVDDFGPLQLLNSRFGLAAWGHKNPNVFSERSSIILTVEHKRLEIHRLWTPRILGHQVLTTCANTCGLGLTECWKASTGFWRHYGLELRGGIVSGNGISVSDA
jgi:hypothetical protein